MNALAVPARNAAMLDFALPAGLDAVAPVEAQGGARHDVRLLVATQADGQVRHHRLTDLPALLAPGDLLVVNTSAIVPAALPATRHDGTVLRAHVSGPLPGGRRWLVELRRPAGLGSEAFGDARAGEGLGLPGGGRLDLHAPHDPGAPGRPAGAPPRLWEATLTLPLALPAYLQRHGHPIRYRTSGRAWPVDAYQTVFAGEPGSAESPSAGRAFSTRLVTDLVAAGIGVTPLVLHTGVSSLEEGEAPYPERYRVPAATAERVNDARAHGHRVVAVGTTAARALETVTDPEGVTSPGVGWTDLEITPERGVRALDGLLTGWHEPRSSHLRLLAAVAGRPLLAASYAAALGEGYRWHEFGDLHLVLRPVAGDARLR